MNVACLPSLLKPIENDDFSYFNRDTALADLLASKRFDCRLWKHGTSFTEQKGKNCHDQDKQVQGASFGFVFGT